MGIKLTIQCLFDDGFKAGFGKLKEFAFEDTKLVYNIGKIGRELMTQAEIHNVNLSKIQNEMAEKEESGKPRMEVKNGKYFIVIADEKKSEYDKKCLELRNAELEIWGTKIPYKEAQKAGVNAEELVGLEPILSGLEDFSEGE